MRVLVTGAGGFVGARVATDLAADGHAVTATWHSNRDRVPAAAPENLAFVQADLAEPSRVDALFDDAGQFDAVVHAAAVVASCTEDAGFLLQAARANVLATANIVAAAGRTGCGHFVFTSTVSVYGDCRAPAGGYAEGDAAPASWYGWSKRSGEEMLDVAAGKFGFTAVSLRLAGVHGRGRESGALYQLTGAAIAGRDLVVNEPDSKFRWVWIDDVSNAAKLACAADWPGKSAVLNLASADIFTLSDLGRRLICIAGNGGRLDTSAATGPIRDGSMNIDAAVRCLGFSPTTLDDFLPDYVAGRRNA